MALYSLSAIIKFERTKRGWTLKELAKKAGVSESTISRIERDKIKSTEKGTIDKICNAFKLDVDNFTLRVVSKGILKIEEIKRQIDKALEQRDGSLVKELLQELDDNPSYTHRNDPLERQFRLRVDAEMLLNHGKKKKYDAILKMLTIAMQYVREDFDINNIKCDRYNYSEIKIIRLIATVHFEREDLKRAYEILVEVKKSMELHYVSRYDRADGYIKVLYNLSKLEGLEGNHSEAMDLCDTAITEILETGNYKMMPAILYNKAYGLECLGKRDESLEIFMHLKSVCILYQEDKLLEFVIKSVKKKFGKDI